MSLQNSLFAAAAPSIGTATHHEPPPGGNILDRAVCLSVELHRLGTKRKVSSQQIDTDADRDMIHVSKDILESEALKAIQKLDGEIRKYIAVRCLPSLFRSGVYLLPIDLIQEVDMRLQTFTMERQMRVDAFMGEYRETANAAEFRLGSLYNAQDYPSESKVRAQFYMVTRYLTFSTPGQLRAVNPALFERETQKMQQQIASATEEITGMLRSAMAELVDHLIDRLSPEPGGKRKVFRDSLVGNVKDFLEVFQARNIADDRALADLVTQAERLLDGVDAGDLRDSAKLRERVTVGFQSIKATLDGMLVTAPSRKVVFDEEE